MRATRHIEPEQHAKGMPVARAIADRRSRTEHTAAVMAVVLCGQGPIYRSKRRAWSPPLGVGGAGRSAWRRRRGREAQELRDGVA